MDEQQYTTQILSYTFPYLEWIITMQDFIQHYQKDTNNEAENDEQSIKIILNEEQLNVTPIVGFTLDNNLQWAWAQHGTYTEAHKQHSRQAYLYLTEYNILPRLLEEPTGQENIWGAILTGMYDGTKPFIWTGNTSGKHLLLIEDDFELPPLNLQTLALLIQTHTKAYSQEYNTKENLLTALEAYGQKREFTVHEEEDRTTIRLSDGTFCDIIWESGTPVAIKYAQ